MNTQLLLLAPFVLLATIFPLNLTKVRINFWTSATLALAVAFMCGWLDVEAVFNILKGDITVQPWKILVIFFTTAYVSISADVTGIFEFISYKLSRLTSDGRVYFLLIYILAGFLTMLSSNDIVILTLTPIMIYLKKYQDINVMPFLFAQFIAANTFSMVVFTGDPTNIIVGTAVGFSFAQFTNVMFLPTIIAGVANFIGLYLVFRKQLKSKVVLKKSNKKIIENRAIAYFSLSVIVSMLAVLFIGTRLGVQIWHITLVAALIMLVKDIFSQINLKTKKDKVFYVVVRMPWTLLPFVIFFFIVVGTLTSTQLYQRAVNGLNSVESSAQAIGLIGGITAIGANVFNNQPATILASNVVIDSSAVAAGPLRLSAFAIIIATSVGATMTLVGTLAGVMWQRILHEHGVKLTHRDYMRVSLRFVPISLGLSLIGLWISTKILS